MKKSYKHLLINFYLNLCFYLLSKYIHMSSFFCTVSMFNPIRNCQAVFRMTVLLTVYERPTYSAFFLFCILLALDIITFYLLIFFLSLLTYMQLYLTMVLFCISLMTNDVEHAAMFLYNSSILNEMSIQNFCPFFILS